MRHAALVIALTGCVSAAQIQEWNSNRRFDLTNRAAFDLGCRHDQIVITNLAPGDELIRLAGVAGCDHRATYVWHPYLGWVMDAASSRRTGAAPP